MQALIVFPHQLFESNAQLGRSVEQVYVVEDSLFFVQYRFHVQKLVLHRASMQAHADYLRLQGVRVSYVDFGAFDSLLTLFKHLVKARVDGLHYIDVIDDWLQRRLENAGANCGIALTQHASPMFLSEDALLKAHFSGRGNPRMARFYMDQRRRKNILMDGASPAGGRWSFDGDNRRRLPSGHPVPPCSRPASNRFVEEAQQYVGEHFRDNPGSADPFLYPVTYADAHAWLEDFMEHRLCDFGAYEDAISQNHDVLFHSLVSPLLNIGLLTPGCVVDAALARRNRVPVNSLEGFIRQIIGWREFMRGAYLSRGRRQRTRNVWNHLRPIPATFWSGDSTITPVDTVIRKVLRSAYAHHIERLMVLANFMQLCEFHPDQVYQWFMEMFIDAYDWVMVPNVYGMALYADGGGITTKPYISGSNYVLKMSDYQDGAWCAIWDGLYWRFIAKHRDEFSANTRTKVLVMGLDRMTIAKRSLHLETADNFLNSLAR